MLVRFVRLTRLPSREPTHTIEVWQGTLTDTCIMLYCSVLTFVPAYRRLVEREKKQHTQTPSNASNPTQPEPLPMTPTVKTFLFVIDAVVL